MLNGTDIQILFWMYKNKISARPKYFFINFDGNIYITDKVSQSRLTGSIFREDLHSQFVMRDLDLTVPRKLIHYVGTHLNVEIEKEKVGPNEKEKQGS